MLHNTAVDYISRNNGKDMVVQTEWPGRRWPINDAKRMGGGDGIMTLGSDWMFDFSVQVRKKSPGDRLRLRPLKILPGVKSGQPD